MLMKNHCAPDVPLEQPIGSTQAEQQCNAKVGKSLFRQLPDMFYYHAAKLWLSLALISM